NPAPCCTWHWSVTWRFPARQARTRISRRRPDRTARWLPTADDHHHRRIPEPEDPPAPPARRAQSNGISLRYQRSPYWPDILIRPPLYSGAFSASRRRITLVVRPDASSADTSTEFTKCKNCSNSSRRRLRILRSTAACAAIVVPNDSKSTYPLA